MTLHTPVLKVQQRPVHRHRDLSIFLLLKFLLSSSNSPALRHWYVVEGGISLSQHSDITSDRLQGLAQFLAQQPPYGLAADGLDSWEGRLTVQAVGSPALADAL